MAVAAINDPFPAGEPSSRLHVVRKPSIRVRQAVRDNNVPLLQRLQHRFDLRNTDRMRLTSLAWAAIEGNLEVFEWLLLDYGHDDQELSRDAEHNTIFHLLAAAPAPPSISPAAHLLTSSAEFPPRPPTRVPDDMVDICLRMTEVYYTLFPFLIDWSNTDGKTALHFAAQADNAMFIATLCDFGADVDLADLQGNTPLHYASAWGNIACARVLLERGATISLRNFEGFTSVDFSYSNQMRAALDAIAREVLENRRARRKEERAREKEERERERQEREQLERWDDGSSLSGASAVDAAFRHRSGSQSSSASRLSAHSSSAHSAHPDYSRGDEYRPPMPPLPPDVLQAAAAATNARNERRDRGSFASRPGSPTPMANRTNTDAVPTLTLSPIPTPTPTPSRTHRSNPPTPSRLPAINPAAGGQGTYTPSSTTSSPNPFTRDGGAMPMRRGASNQSQQSQSNVTHAL